MTSKGKKNTAAKKAKTTPEKQNLAETPVAAGVDKEKMAAFFQGEEENNQAAAAPEAAPPAPPADDLPQEPASGGGDNGGGFSLIFLCLVLGAIIAGWLFYIAGHPREVKNANSQLVATSVVQLQEARVIKQRVAELEALVSCLQARVEKLESVIRLAASKKAAKSVSKLVIEGREKKAKVSAAASSFSKAPVPFWRQDRFRHPGWQGKKPVTPVAPGKSPKVVPAPVPAPKPIVVKKSVPAVKAAPSAVSSSFDKAPVPFWRQEGFNSPQSRARSFLANKKADQPAVQAPQGGDSFSKAPKPFWEK